MEEAIVLREIENRYIDHFLVGFYETGTPFSEARFYMNIDRRITDNFFRVRKEELKGIHEMGDGDMPSPLEILCYLTGRLSGFAFVPVDAVITAYNTIKDKHQTS